MQRRFRFAVSGVVLAIITIAWIALVLARGNANGQHASLPDPCRRDPEFRTYDQWRTSVTFPYVAPDTKLRRIKQNYSHIGLGSSKPDVVTAFGPPDYEVGLAPKEPNRPCVGYAFTYFFEKRGETTNEIKDKRIEVFFTRNGQVNWIVGNVGLSDVGGPRHLP